MKSKEPAINLGKGEREGRSPEAIRESLFGILATTSLFTNLHYKIRVYLICLERRLLEFLLLAAGSACGEEEAMFCIQTLIEG